MIKKTVISVLLATSLMMSMAACSGGSSSGQSAAKEETPATEAVEEETPEAEPAAVTDSADEAVSVEAEPAEAAVTAETASAETAATASTAAAETAAEEVMIENGGLVLPVPEDYVDLLIIETPENDEDGIFFKVAEKASVEAEKAAGGDAEGAGALFEIGVVSKEEADEMLKEDMSGRDLIARDAEGNGYIFYHPTDVRVVRENYDVLQDPNEPWNILNAWSSTVKETFADANPDLIGEKHSNTDLDIYFQQMLPPGRTDYTLTKLDYAMNDPMAPKDELDPTPYLERLTKGVTFSYYDDGEAPDGEYVVLAFPEENVRYDFFFAENGKNIVREVSNGGDEENEEYETLYIATVESGDYTITDVMNEWCDALAAAYGYEKPADSAESASTAQETAQ